MVMPFPALTNDEKFYTDSTEFIPERWLRDTISKSLCPVPKKVSPFVYLPFGFGPRACNGKRFSELEISILLCR